MFSIHFSRMSKCSCWTASVHGSPVFGPSFELASTDGKSWNFSLFRDELQKSVLAVRLYTKLINWKYLSVWSLYLHISLPSIALYTIQWAKKKLYKCSNSPEKFDPSSHLFLLLLLLFSSYNHNHQVQNQRLSWTELMELKLHTMSSFQPNSPTILSNIVTLILPQSQSIESMY